MEGEPQQSVSNQQPVTRRGTNKPTPITPDELAEREAMVRDGIGAPKHKNNPDPERRPVTPEDFLDEYSIIGSGEFYRSPVGTVEKTMKEQLKIVVGLSVCDESKQGAKESGFVDLGLVYNNANSATLQTVWEVLQQEVLGKPDVIAALVTALAPASARLIELGWELNLDDSKVKAAADKVRGRK